MQNANGVGIDRVENLVWILRYDLDPDDTLIGLGSPAWVLGNEHDSGMN
jgi:hypothetical protein